MSLPIGPDFHFHTQVPSSPALDPEGRRLAYCVTTCDRTHPKPCTQLFLVQLPNGTPEAIPGTQGASACAWSPDGEHLAFLKPDARDTKQVWTWAPATDIAKQLTHEQQAVDAFAWSGDGSQIALRCDGVPRTEVGEAPQMPIPRVVRRPRYREDGVGFRGDAFRHLFLFDVATRTARQITFGECHEGPPVWSPDGLRLAFVSDRGPDRETTAANGLYVIDASGDEPCLWSQGLFMVGGIAWSADSARLAVVGCRLPQETGGYSLICQGYLFVLEPGTVPRQITDDSVRPIVAFGTAPDQPRLAWTQRGEIVFLADRRGESYLCRVDAGGGRIEQLSEGGMKLTEWTADAAGTPAVLAGVGPKSTGELFRCPVDPVGKPRGEPRGEPRGDPRGEPRDEPRGQERIGTVDHAYFREHPPARMERFSFIRAGFEIDCRLWLPPDFNPASRYPLVLDVHGGPHSVFYDAFQPIHQILATAGFVVLAPNPRGSSSYGSKFAVAVQGDWGGEDYLDVMAAVQETLARPFIDPARLAIHGSSYGGYLAAWAIGHCDRFRAAVIACPVTNLPSFYGTSDIGVSFGEAQFGGRRLEGLAHWAQRSPLNYAANVTAPVLLLHGEDDDRVPIEQSEQFFVALARYGKHVEFVRMPGASHALYLMGHPFTREQYYERTLDWLRRWLAPEKPDTSTV